MKAISHHKVLIGPMQATFSTGRLIGRESLQPAALLPLLEQLSRTAPSPRLILTTRNPSISFITRPTHPAHFTLYNLSPTLGIFSMSGIEVVALVAGIVSAFTGAGTLFRSWRRDRKERQRQEKNQHLEQALVKGSSDVQKTYDDDFRRLGPMFARGDGMASPISISLLLANAMLFVAEISRSTLAEQLIKLQGTVISVLTGNTPISALVYPNHDLLSDTSIAVRLRSLSVLAEQYQRMSQAARISAPTLVRSIKDCDGTIRSQPSKKTRGIPPIELYCSSCNWKAFLGLWRPVHESCAQTFLEYFHAKGEEKWHRCALCDVGPPLVGLDLLITHLKDKHGYDHYEHGRNNKDGCRVHDLVASLLAGETKLAAN